MQQYKFHARDPDAAGGMMARRPYRFITSCINALGDDIIEMTEHARPVTLKTVRAHCATREIERSLGYDRHFPITRDWHVSYHKSRYRDRPCYFITHSAIEYIFVEAL